MPILSRNYLESPAACAGVAINRAPDARCDASTPILGERANNAYMMIDGMPNRDEIDGGAAVPFALDSILEMQVLTSGYRAEFGRGSGGIVNAATKSGTNTWHGSTSLFHRNSALDTADVPDSEAPFLRRWDTSVMIGGPVVQRSPVPLRRSREITGDSTVELSVSGGLSINAEARSKELIDRPEGIYESQGVHEARRGARSPSPD